MTRSPSTLASIALSGIITTAFAAPFELGATVADRSRRGMGGGKRGKGATFDPTTELDPNWNDGGYLASWSVALVVCANPEKRTLSFAYSALYFGQ